MNKLPTRKDELIQISMKIIMHAGDAKKNIQKAVLAAKEQDYMMAETLMKNAEQDLLLAHKQQTTVIQENIAFDKEPSCLLFAHAQDTFMCVNSEYTLSLHIIDLYEQLANIKQCE